MTALHVDDPPEPGFDEDPNVRHPLTGAKPDYWFCQPGGKRVPRWRPPVLKRGDNPSLWWYTIPEVAARCAISLRTMRLMIKRLTPRLGEMLAKPGKSRVYVRGDAIPIIMRGGRKPLLPKAPK